MEGNEANNKSKDLRTRLKQDWDIVILWLIVLGPATYMISSTLHSREISALKEEINLLREQRDYLDKKLKEGSIARSTNTEPAEDTKQDYPNIKNAKRLTRDEVRRLAQFYNLLNEWKANPQLRFDDGDITFWFQQGLSEDHLKLEFESRRQILEQAEKSGQKIGDQGDLSNLAKGIQSRLQMGK
jgi:hypothetical protein